MFNLEKIHKLTTRTITSSFYLLFFLTPLLFTPWTFELFEFNKMMFVYLITIIISTAWIIQMITSKKILLKRTPFDLPILIFLGSQTLSTLFSIQKRTSLLGYYSRFHGGLLSTISYIILYYAFVTFMGNKEQRAKSKEQKKNYTLNPSRYTLVNKCLSLLLTSATLVAAYGIAQHFGIDKHIWVQDVQNRVFSTLGQPNWLAAFLISVIPLTFALVINKTKSIGYLLFAICYAALLFTKSRSGILGFALMFTLFWSLTLLKNKLKNFSYQPLILFSFVVLVISLFDTLRWIPQVNMLYLKFNPPQTTQNDTTDSPTTNKPATGTQLEAGGTESGTIRRIVWQGALEVFKHYPLFGSGVETFGYSYYNFRPKEHNLVSEWDFLYNKAHNEYLNFLATTGAVGLTSYLLLQAWIFLWLLKYIFSKGQLDASRYTLVAIFSGLAGLSVSNFFGFSTVAVALLFFLYPAISVVLTSKPITDSRKLKTEKLESSQKALIALVLFAMCYMLLTLSRWWYADTRFSLGKKYSDAHYPARAYPLLKQAVSLMPQEPTFRTELSESAADLAIAFSQQEATSSALEAAQIALQESETVQQQNPVHLNFVKSRLRVLITLAELDPQLYPQVTQTILRGLKLNPTDAKLMYHLALIYLQLNDQQKALKTLEKTVEIKPNYEAARMVLGQLYEDLNQKEAAKNQYQYILEHLAPNNTQAQEALDRLQ